MAKPVTTQWDFGELFPPEALAPARKILSVTELTGQIKRLLEQQVGQVWVTGEISNLRLQGSGHIYFALKDAGAQLGCVLFRGETGVDRSLLQDGRKVNLQGELTVYEPRGQYQLRVTGVELQGIGALQAAFEKLKLRLNAEGLFAQERKRPLPRYPQRIGLVTSPTGAAIRDVLHVIERRNPALEIILAPCRVQGDGAAAEIAAAIRLLNEFHAAAVFSLPSSEEGEGRGEEERTQTTKTFVVPFEGRGEEANDSRTRSPSPQPSDGTTQELPAERAPRLGGERESAARPLDLILLTRGGGSLEDLWAFNEEAVARAIFESALPIVSAVGHEIDFTISDFVADFRAATPSVAAEIITEGVFSSCQFLSEAGGRMRQLAQQQIEDKRYLLAQARHGLARVHPRRRLEEGLQRLDDLQAGMQRCAKQGARGHRLAWQNLAARLLRVRPAVLLKQRREVFFQEKQRLQEQVRHGLETCRNRLGTLIVRLHLLGPEQVLARGYSITADERTGAVLRDAKQVEGGQRLKTRLRTGEVRSVAEK